MTRKAALFCILLSAASGGPEDLKSNHPPDREKAVEALAADRTAETARRLLPLLDDEDLGVRMAAIRALAPIPHDGARDGVLRQATHGETRSIRRLAALALKEHAADWAVARIAATARKLTKEDRLAPIQALAILATPEAIEALAKQMTATDPLHRAEAAAALGLAKGGEASLVRALSDKEREVQLRAAASLAGFDSDAAREALLDFADRLREPYILRRIGRGGGEKLAPSLAKRLAASKAPEALLRVAVDARAKGCAAAATPLLEHKEPLVRALAARLLGLGGGAGDRERLAALFGDKDRRVRRAAADAFLALLGADGLAPLLAHENPDVAVTGVRAALARRHKPSTPALLSLARGEGAAKSDWQLRVAACVAAGWVGGLESFDTLRALAAERDWKVRGAALEGLFRIYDKAAVEPLLDAVDDSHPCVKLTAKKNLQYMTQKRFPTEKDWRDYWNKVKANIDLVHPEDEAKTAKEGGYDVRRDMLEILRGTDIVAVLGRWDKVELILKDLEIRHAAIRAQEIKSYGLNPKQVVLVNCEGSVDSETTLFLQWFVATGGYMATTDWALVNALNTTFPEVVVKFGKRSTSNDVVVVEPAEPGHPVLRGVFREEAELQWWLEIQAFPIEIADPVRATVLVDSLQMLLRYERDTMMAEFPAGLGKVLHSTSHFYLQKEGLAKYTDPKKRRVFVADHLGMSVKEIRELESRKFFENINDTTPISKAYSMFQMLVNFLEEKRRIDLAR